MARTLAEAKHEGDTSLTGDHGSLHRVLTDLREVLFGVSKQMSAAEKDRRELNTKIYPVSIPAQSGTVASTNLSIASSELLGPRMGNLWDVTRIAVYGLNSNSETVKVFKSATGAAGGQAAQNFVCTLTPAAGQGTGNNGAFQNFGKGQCVLRAGESFQVSGAALTNGEIVTFSGDATNIAMEYVGEYFV